MKNAPQRLYLAIFLIVSMSFTSGCCTMMRNDIKGQTRIVAYPATLMNVGMIGMSAFSKQCPSITGDKVKTPFWQQAIIRPTFFVGGLIDLPFSLVSDTVLLPYDLITRKKKEKVPIQPWEPPHTNDDSAGDEPPS